MADPCRYPKGDPRYINPLELKDQSIEIRLEYRKVVAREEQNDIEKERNNITFQSIRKSVQGAIVAASIGACALLYDNLHESRNSDHIDKVIQSMVNFQRIETDIHYLGSIVRKDGTICASNKSLLVDIHRKHFPGKYPDIFGNYRTDAHKNRKR